MWWPDVRIVKVKKTNYKEDEAKRIVVESEEEVEEYSPNFRLSPNFTYSEFITSQTAARKGIDNTPTDEHVDNMMALCQNVLEPIRAHYGKPISIGSGYRCPELNAAIGGSSTSQHMVGEAADITIAGIKVTEMFEWIVLHSGLVWDQIICEFATSPTGGWIHISYKRNGQNRKRNTTARKINGQTIYIHYTSEQIFNGQAQY